MKKSEMIREMVVAGKFTYKGEEYAVTDAELIGPGELCGIFKSVCWKLELVDEVKRTYEAFCESRVKA
jgi:hypothetical protein